MYAPAKAFLKQCIGHTAYRGCDYCDQVGSYEENRVCFSLTKWAGRTDEDFRAQVDAAHHLCETPLVEVQGLDMVSGFPIDPMHNSYLGIMKKILVLLCRAGNRKVKVAFKPSLKAHLSTHLEKCGKVWPRVFNRKPRSLQELERWKATEFRTFAL